MVEEYARAWGVSKEEAEKKIRQILKKAGSNPGPEKKSAIPTPDNPFPEPVGEISKKVQDINQAALSTAYTRRLLSAPPEEVSELRGRIEALDRVVGELKSGLEGQIKKLTEILEDKKKEEMRQELLNELDQKISPMREALNNLIDKLKSIEKGGGGESSGGEKMEPEKILEEAEKVVEKSKSWLTRQGYKIEPERLSREDVQKMIEEAQKQALESLPPDELKKRLERAGYKVVGGPLTWDQVEKMVKEERRKAQEEVLEDKRITAVENIVRDSVRQVVNMFSPVVQAWVSASLESRAGQGQTPASAPAPEGQSVEAEDLGEGAASGRKAST